MGVVITDVKINPLYAVAGIAALYVLYKSYKTASAVTEVAREFVTETINPVSDQNYINKMFNSTMAAVTGNEYEGFSFGSWLYDKLHPNENFTTTNPEDLDR